MERGLNLCSRKIAEYKNSRRLDFVTNVVSGNSDDSVGIDVPFPNDYSELLEQVSSLDPFNIVVAYMAKGKLQSYKFDLVSLIVIDGPSHNVEASKMQMNLPHEPCSLGHDLSG